MIESVFRSVKRSCYAGLDSVSLREQVAARIAGAVRFDAHAFGTADPETGLLTHLVSSHMPMAMARAYAEYLYPVVSATHIINCAREGRTVVRAGEESQEVQAEQRAHGFRYGTHVFLASRGLVWGKWCLLRQDAPADALRREHALLRRLVPHLTWGLQQAALIEEAVAAPEGDARTAGVVVFDWRGRVLLRTGSVGPMLADLADIGVVDPDAIPLSVRTTAERARTVAAGTAAAEPAAAHMRAHGRSGRWYTIEACIAEPNAQGESSTVVTVRAAGAHERAEMLMGLYGLSPREREVIAAISRGETTAQIAAELGLSPHTVKEHLDRACEKIGVHGRKALVARLFFDAYRPQLMLPRRAPPSGMRANT